MVGPGVRCHQDKPETMRVKNQVIKNKTAFQEDTAQSPKHSEGEEEASKEVQKRHQKETVLLFFD